MTAKSLEWMEQGECLTEPPELFQPIRGVSKKRLDLARAICADCTVMVRCRDYGVYEAPPLDPAIYGGLTRGERVEVRQGRMEI